LSISTKLVEILVGAVAQDWAGCPACTRLRISAIQAEAELPGCFFESDCYIHHAR
jgi:hypothetical protein